MMLLLLLYVCNANDNENKQYKGVHCERVAKGANQMMKKVVTKQERETHARSCG